MPKKPVRRKYYVYTLAYPDGSVFYVGKGQSRKMGKKFYERMDQHELYAKLPLSQITKRGFNKEKCAVIKSIWAEGGEVVKSKVFETSSEVDALQYEWILIYLVYGIDNLTNNQHERRHRIYRAHHMEEMPDEPKPVVVEKVIDTTPLLSLSEVSEWLGVDKKAVLAFIVEGKFPGYRIVDRWKFQEHEINAYIERNKYVPGQNVVDEEE